MAGTTTRVTGNGLAEEVARSLRQFDGSHKVIEIEIEFVRVAGTGSATPAVQMIIAFAVTLGLRIGGICGAGSVPGSQHQFCNAVDMFASSYAALTHDYYVMLAACKVGAIPCAELIGPGPVGKGQIATKAGGWALHEYTGPNSHQGHIHASGDPLMYH